MTEIRVGDKVRLKGSDNYAFGKVLEVFDSDEGRKVKVELRHFSLWVIKCYSANVLTKGLE